MLIFGKPPSSNPQNVATLSDLFWYGATQVWDNLRRANLNSVTLSEDTITESLILMIAPILNKAPSGPRYYGFSHRFTPKAEAATGADWEWYFVGSNGLNYKIRIQAKRRFLVRGDYRYEGIDRLVGVKKRGKIDRRKKQYNVLINDAKNNNMYPMYIFYNEFEDSYRAQLQFIGKGWRYYGCTFAGGSAVRRISRSIENKAGKTHTVKNYWALMKPWHELTKNEEFKSLSAAAVNQSANKPLPLIIYDRLLELEAYYQEALEGYKPSIPPKPTKILPHYVELSLDAVKSGSMDKLPEFQQKGSTAGFIVIAEA